MPRQKATKAKAAKKSTPVQPVPEIPVQELPPPRSVINRQNLSEKIDAQRQQVLARKTEPVKTNGFGKPQPPAKKESPKAIAFVIMFDNGQIAYAEGDHASTLFLYTQECEAVCTGKGLAYYDGPPAALVTFDEMAEHLTSLQNQIESPDPTA